MKIDPPKLRKGGILGVASDLDEYSLRLDNLMSNLQKLYKTGGPAEEHISRSILFKLDLLLELHNDLQLWFSDILLRRRGSFFR